MISESTLNILEFDRVRAIAAALTVSSLGGERLATLVPFATAIEAEACMIRTAEMVRILSQGELPLHGLSDLRAELRSAAVEGAALDSLELLRIADCAHAAGEVKTYLTVKKNLAPLLLEMARDLADVQEVDKRIHTAIDLDGTVKDDASPELKKIRHALRHEARALEDKMHGLLHRWNEQGYLRDAVISYRGGRLALPVKDDMRHRVQGVIVDQSATGATVFMEPVEALEISNKLRQLEIDEQREIHRVLLDLTAIVHLRLEDLQAALDILAVFDEYYGRAKLAIRWEATDVQLSARSMIQILRGRHPLLIERLKTAVVPLNLEIAPPTRALIISGPNAGGKTVVLKTVGLFSVMAAAGLFLPVAPGSELPFFTAIHADIGDAQSIESDLSTFTAHLATLGRIVTDSDTPKLVLVDEIGASTDPALGTALAQAILLELGQQGAITFVTTHHGALKAFAHETSGMENGSMSFDEKSLVPTYTFRPGVPGSSYALEIAARVGFPANVLERAREFAGKGLLGLEELVSELSRKIEEYETLRRASDLKLTEYGALQKLYTEKTVQLKKIQAETKAKAAAEADAMLTKTGQDMEAVIRAIKKEKASPQAVKAARETISQAREDVEKTRVEAEKILEPPAPLKEHVANPVLGMRVDVEDLSGTGTIVAVQKGGKRVDVEIGGARLTVDVRKLLVAEAEKKNSRNARVSMDFHLDTVYVGDQLDLRGKYGEEALPEVDSYLAAAMESNLNRVTLIHGKGTGALRSKVREFLNTHPLVKSYHDGGKNSDDFGSTVVELK